MLQSNKASSTCNIIVAHLNGSRTCTAAGVTTRGATPVLGLCRQLLIARLDPDARLEVHRVGMVALRVRSLREGARLIVKTAGNGAPIFAVNAPPRGAGASSITQSARAYPSTCPEGRT
jgi:hypothetical protein